MHFICCKSGTLATRHSPLCPVAAAPCGALRQDGAAQAAEATQKERRRKNMSSFTVTRQNFCKKQNKESAGSASAIARHADRKNTENANHIDENQSKNNFYWNLFDNVDFETAEKMYYHEYFSEALKKQNQKHLKTRHKERIKTMDQVYEIYPPERTIYQIGNAENPFSAEELHKIVSEAIRAEQKWSQDHGNPFVIANIAMHVDEPGVEKKEDEKGNCYFYNAQIHVTRIWQHEGKDGIFAGNKNKALSDAGVPKPSELKEDDRKILNLNPYIDEKNKKIDPKKNTRKAVFDALARKNFCEIVRAAGYGVIENATAARSHLSKSEYQKSKDAVKKEAKKEAQIELNEKLDAVNEFVRALPNIVKNFSSSRKKATKELDQAIRVLQNAVQKDDKDDNKNWDLMSDMEKEAENFKKSMKKFVYGNGL